MSGVDESVVTESDPARFVAELAELKARAVAERLDAGTDGWSSAATPCSPSTGRSSASPPTPRTPTPVAADARPVRRAAHRALPQRPGSQSTLSRTASTTVHFADLGDDEIEAYVATGEPLQVAGAFTVDGLGGAFVTGIEGDHHNVVGLSLPVLRELVADLGVRWTDLWTSRP